MSVKKCSNSRKSYCVDELDVLACSLSSCMARVADFLYEEEECSLIHPKVSNEEKARMMSQVGTKRTTFSSVSDEKSKRR